MKKLFEKVICNSSKIYNQSQRKMPPRPSFHISPLYVILPYFNYCKYKSRTKLFLEFVKRIYNKKLIRIVIIEGTPKGEPFDLPDFSSSSVFLHIKVELHDRIWIKENLINLAVRNLPSDWNYVAWIDADLTFVNEMWVQDTIQLLKIYDVVQMFDSAINLGPNGETLKVEKGFVYQYINSGHEYNKNSKYGVWHPGYAWACHRKAYEQMGGLIDFGILGSGDRHMALAWINKAELSYPGNIHIDYMLKLKEFQDNCTDIKINYVPGSVIHHFHGSIKDRRYQERWNILTKNNYSPIKDIFYTKDGILQLTEVGKRLQPPIYDYFIGRNEDGVTA